MDEDLKKLLESLDIDNFDFMIFKDEENGGVAGVLMGYPELIEAIAEGYENVGGEWEDSDLEEYTFIYEDKEEIKH